MGKTQQLEGKLMHWNYRIAKKRSEYIYKNEVKTHYDYFIVEAYYDKNGKIGMISMDASPLYGENVEQLADGFVKMKKAFYLPIIDYHSIPELGYIENDDRDITSMTNEEIEMELEEDRQLDLDILLNRNEDDLIDYERGEEKERIEKEQLYNHLIKEFIYESPREQLKLEDFYKKD
jgi:hypothetical protein